MSIAGIVDALHSTATPPTYRLVWIYLENRSNGARWWAISYDRIARDLGLSLDTVRRAVDHLRGEGVIRTEFKKRLPTVFHMLRRYAGPATKRTENHLPRVGKMVPETPAGQPGISRQSTGSPIRDDPARAPPHGTVEGGNLLGQLPDHTPNPARSTPELDSHPARSTAELTSQIQSPLESTSKSPPVSESTYGPSRSSAPGPKGIRLPRDWTPGPAERDFAISRNIDPDESAAEFRDYWSGVPGHRGVKTDWPATYRNHIRRLIGNRPGPQSSLTLLTVARPQRMTEHERVMRAAGLDANGKLLPADQRRTA